MYFLCDNVIIPHICEFAEMLSDNKITEGLSW